MEVRRPSDSPHSRPALAARPALGGVYSLTMSTRTTSAPRARIVRAERRRAVRVGAMGGVGGAVGLFYEMMGGVSLSAGAGAARTSVEDE